MRYIRQEQLPEIGKQGQEKIKQSTVLIVGVGGLGSICAELLTRAGIGKLILLDNDKVELSNLQRQSLFDEKDIDLLKTQAAQQKLNLINKETEILQLNIFLNNQSINIFEKEEYAFDIAIDCTDNLYTRFLLNDYCKKYNIPCVFGSSAGTNGIIMQVAKETACFNCIFEHKTSNDDCETAGILSTTNHIVASIQINLALHIILGEKQESQIISINSWNPKIQIIITTKRKNCITCGKKYHYLDGKKTYVITHCKTNNSYRVDLSSHIDLTKIRSHNFQVAEKYSEKIIVIDDTIKIVIFKQGRVEFYTHNQDFINNWIKNNLSMMINHG